MTKKIPLSTEVEEADDYLIELMGLKEDFPKEALDAYGKIYERYWKPMLKVARGVSKDEDDAMDLLADTFQMVYKRASSFRKGKIRNPDNVRISIAKWMTAIMQNIFYDNYLDEEAKRKDENNEEDVHIIGGVHSSRFSDDDYDEFIEKLERTESGNFNHDRLESDEVRESENLRIVREYLSRLPERERDIVLTIYDHYIPGKYTPNEVLATLEKRWGTTRENIRKILQKFRSSFKDSLKTKIFTRK